MQMLHKNRAIQPSSLINHTVLQVSRNVEQSSPHHNHERRLCRELSLPPFKQLWHISPKPPALVGIVDVVIDVVESVSRGEAFSQRRSREWEAATIADSAVV